MKKYFNFINEGRVVNVTNKTGNFIMLMGGPGSGKSEISKKFINVENSIYFNVDTEREMMAKKLNLDLSKPEDNYEILNYTYNTTDSKNRTIKLLKLLLSTSKNQLPNIIFDTVGNHVKLMSELIKLAKDSGYNTILVYVKTDINVALQRNINRERKLDNDLVIKYHNSVNKSFDILFPLFDNVWLVDNNDNLDLNYRLNITHKLK